MGVAPHIAALRAKIGHELLLLPSVTVLPLDEQGRVLLVRQADFDTWGTVGGAIDVGEHPEGAARREANEEIGTEVELTGVAGAFGGPQFHLTYPNGDQVAYVSIAYTARIVGPLPTPDNEEVTDCRWFTRTELAEAASVGDFARQSFRALGWI